MAISISIPAPLEDLVRRLSHRLELSGENIIERGHRLISRIPLIGRGTTPPDNQLSYEDQPKIMKTSWGEELGYLVHMSSFPGRFFSDSQIALIDYSDRRDKEVHLGEFRKMGGVYDKHPLDVLEQHYNIVSQIAPVMAQIMGLKLEEILARFFDPKFYIGGKRHDDWEDDKRVKGPSDKFKEAIKAAMQKDPTLTERTPEYEQMMDWRSAVKRARSKIIEEDHYRQIEFINSIGLDKKERSRLIMDGDFAMGVMDWSTRHTEENFFTQSVFKLRLRYTANDYVEDERGGPFQAVLMKRLGVRGKEKEPIEYLLQRIYLRALDRIALSRERKPRYQAWQASELESQFNKYPWLGNVYGDQIVRDSHGNDVRFRVRNGMSRPGLLDILYRNDVVLSNMDVALIEYGRGIVRQIRKNPVAYWYLLAILKAREYLLSENVNIINELKASYKKDLGGKEAQEVKRHIGMIPSQEFDRVTGEGPISNGFRYETGLRVNVEDSNFEIRTNYLDVLAFEELNKRFSDPKRNITDLQNGRFQLFTIEGLRDGISFTYNPKPYRPGLN